MCIEALSQRKRLRGLTLIETIVSLLVISVGVVGILSTMNVSIRHSADPMQQKQMTAIAESLLAEALHQPFTFCDPYDDYASSATNAAGCASAANDQNKGGAALTSPTPTTETRASFNNVADYGGLVLNPVSDVTGSNEVSGYQAKYAVERVGTSFGVADDAALKVTVTVTRGSESFSLSGYRFRYAPRY